MNKDLKTAIADEMYLKMIVDLNLIAGSVRGKEIFKEANEKLGYHLKE